MKKKPCRASFSSDWKSLMLREIYLVIEFTIFRLSLPIMAELSPKFYQIDAVTDVLNDNMKEDNYVWAAWRERSFL